jgi:hypothetical protein
LGGIGASVVEGLDSLLLLLFSPKEKEYRYEGKRRSSDRNEVIG